MNSAVDYTLAGILAATLKARMPRILETFDTKHGRVTIVEPVTGTDDGYQYGYLWIAVIGDYELTTAHLGEVDSSRWVPGTARPVGSGRILATSRVSARACVANARRALITHANRAKNSI